MNDLEPRPPSASRRWFLLLELALLASVAAAAVGWIRVAQSQHDLEDREAEIARLQEAARQTNLRMQQLQISQDELERYRKQAEEVHQLRAQYQEWQRLQEETAALKAENERLRAALGGAAPAGRGSWIGIALGPVPSGAGVAVLSLAPGGPAANSGLQAGDVILAVDATPVTTFQQVKDLIRAKVPGQLVTLDLSRQGSRFQVALPTAPMPSFE